MCKGANDTIWTKWNFHGACLAVVAVVVFITTLTAAETVFSNDRVGELGRAESLSIEGARSFSSDAIVDSLQSNIEFYSRSDPGASMSEYLAWIEKSIRQGYQFMGFHKASIQVRADREAQKIRVRVNEGVQYSWGTLKIRGLDPDLSTRLERRLQSLSTNGIAQSYAWKWKPGSVSATAPASIANLDRGAAMAMTDLNRYGAEVHVELSPDETRRQIDLIVQVKNPGEEGTLERIDIEGLRLNTRDDVLKFLGLKPGMQMTGNLTNDVLQRLWSSGRFNGHTAHLAPLAQSGKYHLTLGLMENTNAPPLGQELRPEEKAMLRLSEWVEDWKNRKEDWVLSFDLRQKDRRFTSQIAMGQQGFAVVTRNGSATNKDLKLAYGFTATAEQLAFYSTPQRRKLTGKPLEGHFQSFLVAKANPNSNASVGELSIGAGWLSVSNGPPVSLHVELAPAALVGTTHPEGIVCRIEKGILMLSNDRSGYALKSDVMTGRLIEYALEKSTNGSGVTLRSEPGGFARLAREIESVGANFDEATSSKHPLSSSLQILGRDFDAGFARQIPEVLDWLGAQVGPGQDGTQLLELLEKFGEPSWSEVLEPLDSLLVKMYRLSRKTDFPSVLDAPLSITPSHNDTMRAIGGIVLRANEECWVRGSWPWAIVRDATFLMAGESSHANQEIQRLMQDSATGPLGCLVACKTLGRLDPRMVIDFARRGAVRSGSADGLKSDLKILFRGDGTAQQILRRALQGVSKYPESDLGLAVKLFGTNTLPLLVEGVLRLKLNPSLPVDEALAPWVDKHWTSTIRPRLLAAFSDAVLGLNGVGIPVETLHMEEVASWLEEAAEAGLPYAQMSIGKCYANGIGVTPNQEKAVRWFLKAEEQGFPHAACELGRLYGSAGDRAKALYWLRRGARDACYAAEMGIATVLLKENSKPTPSELDEAMNALQLAAKHGANEANLELGSILESQGKMEAALSAYRSAARKGLLKAQLRLGDLLSDGFSVPSDNAEAWIWLKLAAGQGDRMAGVQMKSVQRKLTKEQLEAVERRFREVRDEIETQSKP